MLLSDLLFRDEHAFIHKVWHLKGFPQVYNVAQVLACGYMFTCLCNLIINVYVFMCSSWESNEDLISDSSLSHIMYYNLI